MGKLQLLLESVRRKVTAAQQARLKHDSMKSEIANERQKIVKALEQAEQELAHIRNKIRN